MPRYTDADLDRLAAEVRADGHCVLREHFPAATLAAWREAFAPLLERHVAREGHLQNRGAGRYYVTLPFTAPFADPAIYLDADVLGLVDRLVGPEPVMVQLASDTPVRGSDYQTVHRDAPPLFPEWGIETPPFQLAINFPLVDVTEANGPFEVARGTHLIDKEAGLARIAAGEIALEPVLLGLGDVMVRDVRALHRGTPNRTDAPRPMIVVGYSRRWLYRPEVSIRVPREVHASLEPRARELLRFMPVVDDAEDEGAPEVYQAFAY